MGFKKTQTMFEQMNSLFLMLLAFVLVIIFLVAGTFLVRKFPRIKATLVKVNQAVFFNTIHQAIKNTVIPMSITTLFNLKSQIELGQPVVAMASPIFTILFFLVYPIITMAYL